MSWALFSLPPARTPKDREIIRLVSQYQGLLSKRIRPWVIGFPHRTNAHDLAAVAIVGLWRGWEYGQRAPGGPTPPILSHFVRVELCRFMRDLGATRGRGGRELIRELPLVDVVDPRSERMETAFDLAAVAGGLLTRKTYTILLAKCAGTSTAELAHAHGTTETAIRTRVCRALTTLRQQLAA